MDKVKHSESEPTNPLAVPGAEFQQVWTQSTQRFASAMASVSAEMMKFATRRLEAQAKAWNDCAKCTDFPTLTKVQEKYLTQLTADYSNEATELMRRTQDIFANGASTQEK